MQPLSTPDIEAEDLPPDILQSSTAVAGPFSRISASNAPKRTSVIRIPDCSPLLFLVSAPYLFFTDTELYIDAPDKVNLPPQIAESLQPLGPFRKIPGWISK